MSGRTRVYRSKGPLTGFNLQIAVVRINLCMFSCLGVQEHTRGERFKGRGQPEGGGANPKGRG